MTSFDIGATRQMKYSMILRLLQEAAGRHLEELGLSYLVLREQHGMVFLLVEAAVCIHRLPAYGETVQAETWFCGVEGVKFGRGLYIRSGDELCIELGSHWVLVDPETHRILRPSKFPVPAGRQATPDGPMPVPLEKQRPGLLFGKEGEPVPGVCRAGKRIVRYSDLDSNGHVNNAVYVDMLCDFFPDGFAGHAFSSFKIDFLGEAKEQDIIGIRARRQGNTVFFEGQVESHPCFVASATVAE